MHWKVDVVAKKLNISVITLYRYIGAKKVDPPKRYARNNRPIWDAEYVRRIMPQVNMIRNDNV